MATDMGNVRVANVIMLGALIKETRLVKKDTISNKVLPELLSGKKSSLLELNRKALEEGIRYN